MPIAVERGFVAVAAAERRQSGRQLRETGSLGACGHAACDHCSRGGMTARRAEAPAIVTRMGRDRFAGSVRRRRDLSGNRSLESGGGE